jgi:DnaK suppressor protein
MLDFSIQRELLETRLAMIAPKGAEATALTEALKRLNKGEYGYCRICGADIPEEQLRAQPENPFCPSCNA